MTKTTLEERFWKKVDRSGGPDACWPWTACILDGYGQFRVPGGTKRAHRFAWELLMGPIPEGLVYRHLCRNRACVNIRAHGALGTARDNADDRDRDGMTARGAKSGSRRRDDVRPRGEAHVLAILTEIDVLQIRELKSNGVPTRDVVLRFGVCRRHVTNICARKVWKHI